MPGRTLSSVLLERLGRHALAARRAALLRLSRGEALKEQALKRPRFCAGRGAIPTSLRSGANTVGALAAQFDDVQRATIEALAGRAVEE